MKQALTSVALARYTPPALCDEKKVGVVTHTSSLVRILEVVVEAICVVVDGICVVIVVGRKLVVVGRNLDVVVARVVVVVVIVVVVEGGVVGVVEAVDIIVVESELYQSFVITSKNMGNLCHGW